MPLATMDQRAYSPRLWTITAYGTLLALWLYPHLVADPAIARLIEPAAYHTNVAIATVLVLLLRPSIVIRLLSARMSWSSTLPLVGLMIGVLGAVATSGGESSELVYLATPVLVLAAASLPTRQLVALVIVSLAALVGVYELVGGTFLPARVLIRGLTLSTPTIVLHMAAKNRRRQVTHLRRARWEADRRAEVLNAVAVASGSLNSLEPRVVLSAAVGALQGMGWRDVAVLRVTPGGWECDRAVGSLRPRFLGGSDPTGTQQLIEQLTTDEPAGIVTLPIESEGITLTGVRVEASHQLMAAFVVAGRRPDELEAMALQLLASQVGPALRQAEVFAQEVAVVDQLQELQRLQYDVLRTASHELRTPATVLKAGLSLLQARWGDLDHQQRRDIVSRMVRQVDMLERCVSQINEAAESESGTPLELECRELSGADVISAAIAMAGGAAEGRVTVRDVDAVLVHADQGHLCRALAELVRNAVEHSPPDAVVEVGLKATTEELRFRVRNHGASMSSSQVSGFGEAFRRGGDVDTRETRGLGLGLTTARRVAVAHGGTLTIAPADGGGLEAAIVLPRGVVELGAADSPDVQSLPAQQPTRAGMS